MIEFTGRGILLDIEGTTSSVSFVYDVMFPFVRRELAAYLAANWGKAELGSACDQIARDAGHESLSAWCGDANAGECQAKIAREVTRLMDHDVKATGLKQLQGLIWQRGFESGELRAHVYEDVPASLRAWRAAGLDVRIYSSGSMQAQRLFFGHTIHGDLLNVFNGHYDTTIGPKKESASYAKIAEAFAMPPQEILFVSDIPAELDAARAAGMQTGLACRPGNAPVPETVDHPRLFSFADVEPRT